MKVLQNGNDYLTDGEPVEYEVEFNQQTGKMKATSCSGGYNGGAWAGGGGKGGKGKDSGWGKGGGKFGLNLMSFSPYGGGGKGGGGGGVCRNFQQWGECKFGTTCKFSH